jgi:two-component system cell cycle response regulator
MSTKILTVDDSKTIRMIVAKAFKDYDCTVLEADNGVVGLAVAGREKPDLILLDYTMPVMDGFEVLARLRSDQDLKSTPVIMLTAEAGRDTVVKIAKLGVRDYLIKPFKEDLLLERVKRVVKLRSKSDAADRNKRFDDPINLLVLDDKPAIVAQIRDGLADTPWRVTSASQVGEALDACGTGAVNVVLASLSLPDDAAFTFFHNLRGYASITALPVFGLSVRTATAEQARAHQAGFAGILTKPLDPAELKAKVCKALKLETSYKYYRQRDGALTLTLPTDVDPTVVHEVSTQLEAQLTAIVDAGSNKIVIDLSEIQKATLPMIELVLSATELCAALSLRSALIGTDALKADCRSYEETRSWLFAKTFEEAISFVADGAIAQPVPA